MLVAVMSKSGGKDTTTNKKWVSYFDALRVFAALAVVVIHVAARRWESDGANTTEWLSANFWDGIMRWAVPVFIMISGALMLDPRKKFSVKRMYSKNIVRLVTAFVIWSLIYILFNAAFCKRYSGKVAIIVDFVKGGYHMWFIYMIIGLYIITPVLRLITRDKNMTEYFLIVGILLSFVLPGVKSLCYGWQWATGNWIASAIVTIVGEVVDSMSFQFAAGYVVYYVLGYWLSRKRISRSIRIILYILGVLGMILTFYFSQKISMVSGEKLHIFGEFGPWCLAQAVALFVFAKHHLREMGKRKAVRLLSRLSFGIYLLHPLIIESLFSWVFRGIPINYITIPFVSMVAFAVSAFAIWILSKIPIANKYIM